MPHNENLAVELVQATKRLVAASVKTLIGRVNALDERIKAIPAGPVGLQGVPGESIRGEQGNPGESVKGEKGDIGDPGAVGEVGPVGERGADGVPGPQGLAGGRGAGGAQGEKGEPGVAAYELAVHRGYAGTELQWLDSLRGQDGAPGPQGAVGERGVAGSTGDVGPVGTSVKGDPGLPGKDGINGKDGTPGPTQGEVDLMIRDAAKHWLMGIPAPKDGKDGASIHPDTVALMVREAVDKAVAALPAAKDGAPGRDAAELTVLAGIDEARSYPAGTYAKHNGGEIRAERRTDPVKGGDILAAGWTVAREGVSAIVITQGDDPREISVAAMLTSGTKAVSTFTVPMVLDRGVWREGEHKAGDHVSWDGSGWIAQKVTTDKPGMSDAWRLSTKRGRDGKDGDREPPKTGPVRIK